MMRKIIKKLFVFFVFLNVTVSFASEDIAYIELKDLNKLSNKDNVVRVIKANDALLKLKTDNIEKIFFYPPKRFITKATYTGIYNQKIGYNNSKFLEDWIESKYLDSKEINTEEDFTNTTLTSLNTQQFNLFYDEIVLISSGKRFNCLIQKDASNRLHNEKSNAEYIFEFIALGYDRNNNESYILITNYEKVDSNKKFKEYEVVETDYINARKAVENKQYDYALTKMSILISKYPENIEYKQDYCNILLTKSFRTNTKISENIINCYNDILKKYNSPEVNYILATIYYNDDTMLPSTKNKLIVKYTTNAIDIISTKNARLSPREAEVYHNSLYLRGISKINLKDSSGYNDLKLLQKERPDLIFNGIFEKR